MAQPKDRPPAAFDLDVVLVQSHLTHLTKPDIGDWNHPRGQQMARRRLAG